MPNRGQHRTTPVWLLMRVLVTLLTIVIDMMLNIDIDDSTLHTNH